MPVAAGGPGRPASLKGYVLVPEQTQGGTIVLNRFASLRFFKFSACAARCCCTGVRQLLQYCNPLQYSEYFSFSIAIEYWMMAKGRNV